MIITGRLPDGRTCRVLVPRGKNSHEVFTDWVNVGAIVRDVVQAQIAAPPMAVVISGQAAMATQPVMGTVIGSEPPLAQSQVGVVIDQAPVMGVVVGRDIDATANA